MTENDNSINSKKAISFLKTFHKDRPVNLVAINPVTEKLYAITRPVSDESLHKFINAHNGINNIYFTVNTPYLSAGDKKLKKSDIEFINATWLDADPDPKLDFKQERKRLFEFALNLSKSDNPPSLITDSGGGIQAFWILKEPIRCNGSTREEFEALSRGLSEQYNTDKVHNIDRLMRLPHTWNIPTKKKKNREKVLARKKFTDNFYTQDQLKTFINPSYVAESDNVIDYKQLNIEEVKKEIPSSLKDKLNEIRKKNKKIDDLWTNRIDLKPSRSERDFTLTKELKLEGFTINEAANILWNFEHGKNKDLSLREIIRCYERSGIDFIDSLDPVELEKINNQTNPILAARAAGKPLDEDLNRTARFRSVPLHEMKWRSSGRPIYKDFLYDKAITVIYGKSNTGKSFLTTDIAGHIALKRDWNGMQFKSKKQLGVLYICAEAGQSFGVRGRALLKRLNVDKLPFNVITDSPSFVDEKMEDAKAIVNEINRIRKEEGIRIGLVVVDTLAVTFQGNENSSEDMGDYIRSMKYIQRYADTGVLIVHHSGKDQAAGARGSSALQAATDTEMEVKSEKRGEREARQVEVKKQREGKSGMIVPFGLHNVELGKDDFGDEIDTCYVVLEKDDEYEDVSVSLLDELKPNQVLALEAAHLLQRFNPNPDMFIHDGKEFTIKEVTALILKDLKERDKSKRILLDDVGVLSDYGMEQLAFCAKPVPRGITKALEDQRKSMEQKNVIAFNDEYQLVSEYMELMELRWNS